MPEASPGTDTLTLCINSVLLEKVRARAEARGVSVSDLLSHHLATLVREEERGPSGGSEPEAAPGAEAFGPVTRSLGAKPERDEVTEADYRRYLAEKHR